MSSKSAKLLLWSPQKVLFLGGSLMCSFFLLGAAVLGWARYFVQTSERNNISNKMISAEQEQGFVSSSSSSEVVNEFDKPMCDSHGICGETPSIPSPRTTFSARSETQMTGWFKFHDKLMKDSWLFARNLQQQRKGAAESFPVSSSSQASVSSAAISSVVFLGDSITESFRGTSYDDDRSAPRLAGIEALFSKFCIDHAINPLVLAISGDQTQHLLWRLQNGELSDELKTNPKLTFVLHIGTNNIGAGFLPQETAAGVIEVAEYLLRNTVGNLLLVLLLPRGDGKEKLIHLCPPRCNHNGLAFASFLSPLRTVNELIMQWFDDYLKRSSTSTSDPSSSSLSQNTIMTKRLHVVSCWDLFINNDHGTVAVSTPTLAQVDVNESEVILDLMPDKLHPNVKGHALYLNRIGAELRDMF
jgi:lysophospholipase L1-like esterase